MTRIGIVSDIHGNLPALEAVIALLLKEGVDITVSCGDLVGYGPWPGEVVSKVRDLRIVGVQGNHDAAVCGALPVDHFNAAARSAIGWIRSQLSEDEIGYLAGLPQTRIVEGMEVVHGSPRGPLWEYILDPWTAGESFRLLETDICLFGHSHIQGGFTAGGSGVETIDPRKGWIELLPGDRYLVNPGSVGQPRDGDPRAACAIIDLEKNKVFYHRVPYDISATQREIIRVGLPRELADRLSMGR